MLELQNAMTPEQMRQSGFNLGSLWLQLGTNMAPIWWFCQAAAKFVIEQKMWLKKIGRLIQT